MWICHVLSIDIICKEPYCLPSEWTRVSLIVPESSSRWTLNWLSRSGKFTRTSGSGLGIPIIRLLTPSMTNTTSSCLTARCSSLERKWDSVRVPLPHPTKENNNRRVRILLALSYHTSAVRDIPAHSHSHSLTLPCVVGSLHLFFLLQKFATIPVCPWVCECAGCTGSDRQLTRHLRGEFRTWWGGGLIVDTAKVETMCGHISHDVIGGM